MPTIFTRIIDGEIPATFVWKDEQAVAFLSINPMAPGHVLVVPRAEVDHWIDCPPELSSHLFEVAHVIGRAQREAFDCDRVGVIVAGYEVPHTHVHVIPTEGMHNLSFANAATTVSRDDLEDCAERIRVRLRAAGRSEVV
jgi:diadenosine tetraphosphate (Ap4A) HIT family hydrolase